MYLCISFFCWQRENNVGILDINKWMVQSLFTVRYFFILPISVSNINEEENLKINIIDQTYSIFKNCFMREDKLWLSEKKEILLWQVVTPTHQPRNFI